MAKVYVDKNEHFINVAGVIVHDGMTYPGNVLQFPDVVEAMGIHLADAADPPEDYSHETHGYSEQREAPYRIYPRKPQEVVDAAHNARVDAEIVAIEASQARCVREAILTGDKTRLQQIEDRISAKRIERRFVPPRAVK